MTRQLPFDKEALATVCSEHGIVLLGSFSASQDWQEDDEIDLYVRLAKSKDMRLAVTLERHLGSLFQRQVSLVMEGSLTPHMRQRILKDLEILYEND